MPARSEAPIIPILPIRPALQKLKPSRDLPEDLLEGAPLQRTAVLGREKPAAIEESDGYAYSNIVVQTTAEGRPPPGFGL